MAANQPQSAGAISAQDRAQRSVFGKHTFVFHMKRAMIIL